MKGLRVFVLVLLAFSVHAGTLSFSDTPPGFFPSIPVATMTIVTFSSTGDAPPFTVAMAPTGLDSPDEVAAFTMGGFLYEEGDDICKLHFDLDPVPLTSSNWFRPLVGDLPVSGFYTSGGVTELVNGTLSVEYSQVLVHGSDAIGEQTVPEPGTPVMVGAALLGALAWKWSKAV